MEMNRKDIGGGCREMSGEVVGIFYPADPDHLRRTVDTYCREADVPNVQGKLRAIMVPHAGYIYSGPVAAMGYRLVRDLDQETNWTVIIIGPSHYVSLRGVSVGLYDEYECPLGSVPVSRMVKHFMDSGAVFSPQAHEREHSIEVQLPFLRHCLRSFEIVTLLTGSVDAKVVADLIEPHIDEKTIIVVSTDLSHEKPYDAARNVDTALLNRIIEGDESAIKRGEACGIKGVHAMVILSKRLNWRRQLIGYATSGDTFGSKNRVVGYGCVACLEDLV